MTPYIPYIPQPIFPGFRPGGGIAMAKQTDRILTALLVDFDFRLSVTWLDLDDGEGWHPPIPFSPETTPSFVFPRGGFDPGSPCYPHTLS